jgi:trehalose 6-phosphate phosphatase
MTSSPVPASPDRLPDRLQAGVALFLDLDGTLAPIAARPRDVILGTGQRALLRDLALRLDGRLAIVSGRSLDDLDRILEGCVTPLAGVHGLERRRADGMVIRAEPSPGVAGARTALLAFVERHPALLLEDKGLSLALHYRAAPELAGACLVVAEQLAHANGLILQPGDMLVELRTPGADKGDAIRAFMVEAPFIGGRPIFVGDDLTDENGFVAARELGGTGVLVGSDRPTSASRRLADVGAVFAWINASMTGSVTA